jgi:hypothetical protein
VDDPHALFFSLVFVSAPTHWWGPYAFFCLGSNSQLFPFDLNFFHFWVFFPFISFKFYESMGCYTQFMEFGDTHRCFVALNHKHRGSHMPSFVRWSNSHLLLFDLTFFIFGCSFPLFPLNFMNLWDVPHNLWSLGILTLVFWLLITNIGCIASPYRFL